MVGRDWYRRVVPVTALAVGLVAVLALLLPGVRHQLALSASHQPQQYVVLAFGRTSTGNVVTCAHDHHRVRVTFAVGSHLSEPRDLPYVVTVHGDRRTGTVTVDPGRTERVTRMLASPRVRRFEVRVELPTEDREVHASCVRPR